MESIICIAISLYIAT